MLTDYKYNDTKAIEILLWRKILMSSGPRAAGKQAFRPGKSKMLPKNGELDKQWGPGWEAEWLAGWEEAEQEYLLGPGRGPDPGPGM